MSLGIYRINSVAAFLNDALTIFDIDTLYDLCYVAAFVNLLVQFEASTCFVMLISKL